MYVQRRDSDVVGIEFVPDLTNNKTRFISSWARCAHRRNFTRVAPRARAKGLTDLVKAVIHSDAQCWNYGNSVDFEWENANARESVAPLASLTGCSLLPSVCNTGWSALRRPFVRTVFAESQAIAIHQFDSEHRSHSGWQPPRALSEPAAQFFNRPGFGGWCLYLFTFNHRFSYESREGRKKKPAHHAAIIKSHHYHHQ